jgi:hypothetical protein
MRRKNKKGEEDIPKHGGEEKELRREGVEERREEKKKKDEEDIPEHGGEEKELRREEKKTKKKKKKKGDGTVVKLGRFTTGFTDG